MPSSSKPFRPFSKTARTDSPIPNDVDLSNVLTRLHALFNHSRERNASPADVGSSRDGAAINGQYPISHLSSPTPPPEQEAIKVKIITWNMGDELVCTEK